MHIHAYTDQTCISSVCNMGTLLKGKYTESIVSCVYVSICISFPDFDLVFRRYMHMLTPIRHVYISSVCNTDTL